ncbi:hypothetical protein GOODEAATRI_030219, partial [Goodea atripinnis]
MSWGPCSVSCGGGSRKRTRLCASPAPQHGGRKCEGNDVHTDFCNGDPCPISGNWGQWSSWGSCSKTCSGGQMRRYRTCDNPIPAHGGRACAGADSQMQKCSTADCPVDGNWGLWQPWGGCSASCGGGERTRVRLCNSPTHFGELVNNTLFVQDYTEEYIQTGPGQLYALSTRMFTIDKESLPYSWNHTISYDLTKGKMPFLVEMLHATAISDRSNQCPHGFTLVSAGPYCADENECEIGNPCSHTCHNTMGTYYCSCPHGLTISADGKTCQ